MATYKWDESYSVGVPHIDAQHKDLFLLAYRLDYAVEHVDLDDEAALANAVYGLVDYIVEHFADEEALMARYSYPAAGPHRALHEELSGKTLEFVARYVNGEPIATREIAPLVCNWLTNHIPTHDLAFAQHIARVEAAREAQQLSDEPAA